MSLLHLQYKDYCIDLLAIDTMCKERDIKWYPWTINNRVFVPKTLIILAKHRAGTSAPSIFERTL